MTLKPIPILVAAVLCFCTGLQAANSPKTDFDPRRDGFGFSNDTTREYAPDASGVITAHPRKPGDVPAFRHGCFLMIRATLQFAHFARFAPEQPQVSDEEYRRRLRQLFRIPAREVARSESERIVIPGYRNVFEFTKARRAVVETTIGAWQPTYLRIGNWRMAMPFPRFGQAMAARRFTEALDRGNLQAAYLAHGWHMNHCVLLYDYTPEPGRDIRFSIYDPNDCGNLVWLRWHANTRTFELQKRYFFNEGRVNAMRVYNSPFQ